MQYRIIVASSKGGVGKSTSSALLAVSLASRGKRVLLCDLDLGTRCLDMFFGTEDRALFDIGDLCLGRAEPSRAVLSLDAGGGGALFFAPSSLSLKADEVDSDRLCDAVVSLAEYTSADFVICDTAGSVIPLKLAKWANLGIVCATQMPVSVRSAEASANALRSAGLEALRLLITAFDYTEAKNGIRSGLLNVIDGSSVRAIGVIPYDRALMLAQEKGALPPRKSPAALAYDNVAARLCGEERRLFAGIGRMKGSRVL